MMNQYYKYVFSIAGIVIQIDTDQCLEMEDAFVNFQTRDAKPDVVAVFRQKSEISKAPDNIFYQSNYYQIRFDENGLEKCYFINSMTSLVPYAERIVEEENHLIRIDYLHRGRKCVSELRNSFSHLLFESILLEYRRLYFHAACIDTAFGGILFTGESGIGKSTQAELWHRFRDAEHINGDRPILSCEDGKWKAWGSPYAGSSNYHVNDWCDISVIVSLKKGDVCKVRKLNRLEAFKTVWKGITVHSWNRSFMEKASELVDDLVSRIPVLEFTCTPNEQAVEYLEQQLRKEWNCHE